MRVADPRTAPHPLRVSPDHRRLPSIVHGSEVRYRCVRSRPRQAGGARRRADLARDHPALQSATGSRQFGYSSTVPGMLGCRRSPTASLQRSQQHPRRAQAQQLMQRHDLLVELGGSRLGELRPFSGSEQPCRDQQLQHFRALAGWRFSPSAAGSFSRPSSVTHPDVITGKKAGRGRQIVRGHRRDRRRAPLLRRHQHAVVVTLEPDHRRPEHRALGKHACAPSGARCQGPHRPPVHRRARLPAPGSRAGRRRRRRRRCPRPRRNPAAPTRAERARGCGRCAGRRRSRRTARTISRMGS